MAWHRKHLLDIESLTADEIVTVLDTARAFKAVGERAIKKVPALRGKTIVNLFIEPSTRTRISFELAEQRLSADIINFTAEASSLKKGETLKDTARNLEALNADFIVMRHSASGAPHFLARVLNASVINAGDGAHEHPTQALLDAFTIRERKGRIAGLNVTILGDILYSRVARSDIWALTKLGAHVTLCGPSTLVPRTFEQMGCRVTYDVDEAIRRDDITLLDVRPIDMHFRGGDHGRQRTPLNRHHVAWLQFLRQYVTLDYVITQDGLELCGVLEQRIQRACRELLECFVGGCEDRESALAGELIGKTGRLEAGNQRCEIACRDHRFDDILRRSQTRGAVL